MSKALDEALAWLNAALDEEEDECEQPGLPTPSEPQD